MQISVVCPNCSRVLRVGDELTGQLINCRVCGNPFRVKPLNDLLRDNERGFDSFQESELPAGSADTDSDMPLTEADMPVMTLQAEPETVVLTSPQAAVERQALSASSQTTVSVLLILALLGPPILSGVVAWYIADGLSGFMWYVVFVGTTIFGIAAAALSTAILASICIGIKGAFERKS